MEQAQTRAWGRDEELAALARVGDTRAAGELVRRFEWLATGVASRYYLQGGDRDDLHQEARLGVFKAARDFDPAAGSSFGSFARLCVERQVITAIKTAGRVKHQALTGAIRTAKAQEGDTVFDAVDVIEAANADAHELLVDRERALLILRVCHEELSEIERACLVGYANGDSYIEIERRIVEEGIDRRNPWQRAAYSPTKVVDNGLTRARRKIQVALTVEDGRLPLGAAA